MRFMRYIKDGKLSDDPWVVASGEEPVPADIPVIVSGDWLLEQEPTSLERRGASLGVSWPNDRPVEELAPYLPHLALIALEFPAFKDGRAYSQARQLRDQYRFEGEIRATGDVLRDQFIFMVRAGFNAFEVRKEADAQHFEDALHQFSGFYQPGSDRAARPLLSRFGRQPAVKQ